MHFNSSGHTLLARGLQVAKRLCSLPSNKGVKAVFQVEQIPDVLVISLDGGRRV